MLAIVGSPAMRRVLVRLDPHRTRYERLGYSAPCPAHDDRAAGLTIREARDGRVLLSCSEGCDVRSIAAALGLKMTDLFNSPAVNASVNETLEIL